MKKATAEFQPVLDKSEKSWQPGSRHARWRDRSPGCTVAAFHSGAYALWSAPRRWSCRSGAGLDAATSPPKRLASHSTCHEVATRD